MNPNRTLLERLQPAEGWTTLLLPWLLMLVSAAIVAQAELARNYEMHRLLFIAGTVGAASGFMLAKSRFPALTAHIYGLIYCLFTVTVLIGRVMPGAEEMIWRERVAELVLTLVEWITQIANGGTNRDIIVWVTYTTLIYWVLGYTMMWYTFRNLRVWRVVVPAGLVDLSVVYYYFGPRPLALLLALYCLLALLYIAQTHLVTYQRAWLARNVRFELGIGGNFIRSTLLVALVVLAVAWNLPTLTASASVIDTVSQVNEPWRQFRDGWQRLFAALDSSYSQGVSDVYGETLVLGGPRNPGDFPVMDVWVDEKLPYAYWRAQVLHTYNGDWEELDGETVAHFPDEGLLDIPETQARVPVVQRFINFVPDAGTIYSMPDMIQSDKQLFVRGTVDPTGNTEVSNIRSRFVLQQGDQYEVLSQMSMADASSLRRASTNYAPFIRKTYLQLPDSVTPETRALAAQITAPYNNPFDKAIAVRDWLRTNITYNDQVNWPPPGMDPVHYMLFESQEGFCNYYASAMALMLRSEGIPTRVARGFAAGEFIEETNTYRVRAKDAHTWPEVFFPGYGWIQFEPTTIIPEVPRAEGEGGDFFAEDSAENTPFVDPDQPLLDDEFLSAQEAADFRQLDNQAEQAEQSPLARWALALNPWQVLGAVLVLLVALVAILLANRFNRQVESDLFRSYGRLGQWGRWLGVPITPTQTPYERAEVLAAAAPDGARSIQRLIGEYVTRTFSPEKNGAGFFSPLGEWKTLRPILLRRAVEKRLPRRLRRSPDPATTPAGDIPNWLRRR